MVNIPTDLLRTFIAVVDLRSFTRAAATFGVTQPAVSAQIIYLPIRQRARGMYPRKGGIPS